MHWSMQSFFHEIALEIAGFFFHAPYICWYGMVCYEMQSILTNVSLLNSIDNKCANT